jgi:DNA-binding PadR family transcriptional regulator
MQKMLEATGKGQVVNIRSRASLYQALDRLERHGLVAVAGTGRTPGYPDRVEYAITDHGREVARTWLREMLSGAREEYPEFIAALSIMFALEPEDARSALEERESMLAADLDAAEQALSGPDVPPGLPRLFLLEEEYRCAMLRAEIGWLRDVIEDLRTGRLTWSEEWLREIGERFLPAEATDASR